MSSSLDDIILGRAPTSRADQKAGDDLDSLVLGLQPRSPLEVVDPHAAPDTADEEGRGVRKVLVAGLEKGLDFLARTEYASASAARAILHDNFEDVPKALSEGIRGKRKVTYIDIASDELGLSQQPFFGIPDFKYVPNFLEHIARSLASPAGATGLALGMVLDPLSWVGAGMLSKGGELARIAGGARAARKALPEVVGAGAKAKLFFPEGGFIAQGSRMAREFEEHFARTGQLPAPLAQTLGEQAQQGSRALFGLQAPVIPFTPLRGQPIATLVRGRPIFAAATRLRELVSQKAPQVDAALRFFSNFGIHPETLDDFARALADQGIWGARAAAKLQKVARLLHLDEPAGLSNMEAMTRAIESTAAITEERFRTVTRSVPIEHRVVGTARFATAAIDEATGAKVLAPDAQELDILRERLGLQPNQQIVRIQELGSQAVMSPSFPLDVEFAHGMHKKPLEALREDGSFLALEFGIRQGEAFNPEFGNGINRVLIDMDMAGRPEAIDAQIRALTEKLPTMTLEERAAAGPVLDGLAKERLRALRGEVSARKWRVSLLTKDPKTGSNTVRKTFHAENLNQVYEEILGPLTSGRPTADFYGHVTFLDDTTLQHMKHLAREQTRYQKLYGARARLASRFEESVEALKPEIIAARKEELEAMEGLYEQIRELGGLPGGALTSNVARDLNEAYTAYLKKLGRTATPITVQREGLPMEQMRELAAALGFESDELGTGLQAFEAALREQEHLLRQWTKQSPWMEAKNQLIYSNNPDWLRLERYDQALMRLGLREPPVGEMGRGIKRGTLAEQRIRKEKQQLAKEPPVEVPAGPEVAQAGLKFGMRREEKAQLLADIEELEVYREVLPRFSNLDRDTRLAAVELERFYAEYAQMLRAIGALDHTIPGYVHHARYDKLDMLRRLASFQRIAKNAPIEVRKPAFTRTRTIREGIHDIKDRSGLEFFMTDVLSASALYAKEANRFIATTSFINRTLSRLIQDGAAHSVDARKIDWQKLDPRMGVYFPKGRLQFYPAKVVPAARVERQMAEGLFDDLMSGRAGKALVEIKPEDFRTMIGVSKAVPAYVMPKATADFLNRANALYTRPEGLGLIRNLLLGVRNVWARWTLFPFLGYHLRNGAGNVLNNLLRGVNDPERYRQAALVQHNKPLSITTSRGETLTEGLLRQESTRYGVVDAGFYANIAGDVSALDEQIRKGFGSRKGWRAALDKYGPSGYMQAAMRVAGLIENNARLALYIDRRIAGDAPELAARMVRETLFDSATTVPVDRFAKSYLMPFWGWTRNNIPLQVKHLIQRPGYYASTERMIRLIQASTNPDDEVLPQWMHESLPVRLFETPGQKGEYRYFLLRNWHPAADLQSLFEPHRSFLGMLAPWWRVPIERLTNHSNYFRRPIEPYPGARDSFLGMNLRRRDIEVLRSIALLQSIDQVFTPGEDHNTDTYLEPNVWDRLVASRFGIGKLYLVDLNKERFYAQQQQARFIRELKIAQRMAVRAGDEVAARQIAERIRDEQTRTPTFIRALPRAVPAAEF